MCARKKCDEPGCCDAAPLVLNEQNARYSEDLAVLARAIAHPMRVLIVRLLLKRKTCVCGEIVNELPLAQSTVSQHLKILKESGLVQGEVDGPKVCYCVDVARLKLLKSLIGDL